MVQIGKLSVTWQAAIVIATIMGVLGLAALGMSIFSTSKIDTEILPELVTLNSSISNVSTSLVTFEFYVNETFYNQSVINGYVEGNISNIYILLNTTNSSGSSFVTTLNQVVANLSALSSVSVLTINGQSAIGNNINIQSGSSAILISGSANNIVLTLNTATVVTSFSGGTTGLTPGVATTGNVVLGGTLEPTNGGTGQFGYTIGDILYASSTTTLVKLTIGTAGQVLTVSGGVPVWQNSGAGSGVSTFQTSLSGLTPSTATNGAVSLDGTLGPTSGGTGLTSYTTGDIVYGSGTNTLAALPIGTNGQILGVSGGVPAWQNAVRALQRFRRH